MQPPGTLQVDKNGVITTPGGYKIEQLGQFEWKITGPDGKNTRVWGDPHVDEGDGGKWDFKKNTCFVLGDGTHINCTTKPYGNGMTVTGQLDIVAGDQHIAVTDIDKGKGKVGTVQNDGLSAVVKFAATESDTVTMGKETDDWNFELKEIIGSEGGGDKLITSDKESVHTRPGTPPRTETPRTTAQEWAKQRDLLKKVFDSIGRIFDTLRQVRTPGFNPFTRTDGAAKHDRAQHRQAMERAFNSVNTMFRVLDQVSKLNDMVARRNTQIF